MKRIILFIAALAASSFASRAEIVMPSFFSDNMVLQRESDAAIWGKATPGKTVTISASWKGSKKIKVAADAESGKWFARIATPAAGGPYSITISDGKALTLNNVLIGDVWFCSGQSNMEMPVKGFGSQPVKGSTEFIVGANPSRNIRMCTIHRKSSTVEESETKGSWMCNDPVAVGNTSAAAYFFADQIEKSLGIPVGLLITDWGGSSIETWICRVRQTAPVPSSMSVCRPVTWR